MPGGRADAGNSAVPSAHTGEAQVRLADEPIILAERRRERRPRSDEEVERLLTPCPFVMGASELPLVDTCPQEVTDDGQVGFAVRL
jgi:hypothetical protein